MESGTKVYHEKYGNGTVHMLASSYPITGRIFVTFDDKGKRPVNFANSIVVEESELTAITAEALERIRVRTFIDKFEYSGLLKEYLRWLREAGDVGVENVCGCAKDQNFNYTCACRTLVKLHHRFSTFKDALVNKLGYKIDDYEMENGRHKTILRFEPVAAAGVI